MQTNAEKKKLQRFVIWYFAVNAIYFILFGLSYLKVTFQSDTLFVNYHVNYASIFGKIFIISYWILYYCSFMPLLAFIPALPLLVLAYLLPQKKVLFPLCILFALVSLLLLIIDSRIFSMFNFHLNATLISFFFNERWNDIFGFSTLEIRTGLLLLGILLGLEIGTARIIWRNIIQKNRSPIKHPVLIYWAGITLYCNLTLISSMQLHYLLPKQLINFPLCSQFLSSILPKEQKNELTLAVSTHFSGRHFPDDPIRYPLHPMQCQKPSIPYNIVFILIDSLRFNGLSSENMHVTTEFAEQSWQFQNHISGGNCTQPGLFSLFYSIPSSYWTATIKHKTPPILMQLLSQNNYASGVFWSAPFTMPAFDKTIYQSVADNANFYSSKKRGIGDRDRDVTLHAINFLNQHNHKRPFFLNVFYDSAHSYCVEQNFNTPHLVTDKPCFRLTTTNPADRVTYYNRYRNALHFLDGEIAKLLETIKKEGYFENSIIVISSDHGEEFDDSGRNIWGHSSNMTAAQTHIPLIIHWPGEKPKTFDYVTTSYDLVPTFLQKLFACNNDVSDYSVGQNLLSEKRKNPYPIIVGSYVNMGYIEPERLTILNSSGDVSITDPQLNPILHEKPNVSTLQEVLSMMRKYYIPRAESHLAKHN